MIVCNRNFSAEEVLRRCIVKSDNGCPAINLFPDSNAVDCSLTDCSIIYTVEEIIKTIALFTNLLVVSNVVDDYYPRVSCDEYASIQTLFNECFTSGDTELLLRVQERDLVDYSCTDIVDCIDEPLESLIKKCFIKLNSGCTAIQIMLRDTNDGNYNECSAAETIETILRKLLIPVGDGTYAFSATYNS